MKIAIRERDLSDEYLRFAAQVGADGVDFHAERHLPGIADTGRIDAAGLRELLARIRGFGLEVFRVTPPRPLRFFEGDAEGEREVDNLARLVEALGAAGVPIMSMPVHRQWNRGYRGLVKHAHRGGYRMNAFDPDAMRRGLEERPAAWTDAAIDVHFDRCRRLYERLVPVAEASGVGLVIHPSDPPLPDAEFSPERWFGIVDAVPSPRSGLLYCVGTRREAGADVPAEIRALGSRGTILHVHFRNVRGRVDAPGGYEEVALDDGEMDMLAVLRALLDIGYEGVLQVDHLPEIDGDDGRQSAAHAVGFIRGLMAAVASASAAPAAAGG